MLKQISRGLIAATLLVAGFSAIADEIKSISGAGATFPFPIYAKWAAKYAKETGIQLNYQAIGSGGGIKQISAKTVDFGASDAPLKPEKLNKIGLMQFPMVMGGVVPAINLPGIKSGSVKLSGEVLADIFLGKIKKWNDAQITALNPTIKLPSKRITVVHRSDGSGTTWIFTNYLSKVSANWKQSVGTGKAVKWPAGVGGKGNQGVASYVSRIKGSIGYVEYAYALQNKMVYTQLQNKDGHFVNPTSGSFQAAAAGADWKNADGFYLVLTNQPGAKSWPITGATFILVYTTAQKPEVTRAVLTFFDWCYKNGDKMAEELHFVPMPDSVVALVKKTWSDKIKTAEGHKVWK